MKRTRIVLQEPYEVLEVADGAEWTTLALTQHGVELGNVEHGVLLTVPWWRVEEIRSDGVNFTPPHIGIERDH